MTQLIFTRIGKTYTYIPTEHYGGSGHFGLEMGLLIFLIMLYIVYFMFVCIERSFFKLTKKQFIIFLIIPFSMWFNWFLKLFKDK